MTGRSDEVLSVTDIRKTFGSFVALDGVSFSLARGQTIALLGPSGSGKTTALRCIAGLETIDRGRIVIDGGTVDDGRRRVPASRRRAGMVFQNYALWPHMTVSRNVAFVAQRQGGLNRADAKSRAGELLTSFHLGDLVDRRPGEMSGGQQQRVAVARALAGGPSILLMDEPLSALDAQLRLDLRHEVRQTITDSGLACVYVTHDQDEALAVADLIALMWHGRLVELGDRVAIYSAPATLVGARFFGCRNSIAGEIIETAQGGTALAKVGSQAVRFTPAGGWVPQAGDHVTLAFRPESASVEPSSRTVEVARGRVRNAVFVGTAWEYLVDLGGAECLVRGHLGPGDIGTEVAVHADPASVYGYRGTDPDLPHASASTEPAPI